MRSKLLYMVAVLLFGGCTQDSEGGALVPGGDVVADVALGSDAQRRSKSDTGSRTSDIESPDSVAATDVIESDAPGVEDDVSESSCSFFHTYQPPEDPSLSCWLADESALDSLEYVCTPDHPCLDMERDDHQDHTEDSY